MSDNPNKAEKQMEKQIFISGDGWLCVFDLLPPRQLGLQIALISNRFDFYVDEHFKTRRRKLGFIRIWRKIGEDGKKEMDIIDARGQPLPVPTEPMPNKVIGFNGIVINYLDRNVMAFLHHFDRLFTACGTLSIKTNCDRLLEFVLRNIPSSARVHLNSSSSSVADHGQPLLIKWLCSSSPRAPSDVGILPKVLSLQANELTEWLPNIEDVKTAFLNASSPANFIVVIREPWADYVIATHVTDWDIKHWHNQKTGEQLTYKRNGSDRLLLIRCPISRDEQKWAQWEGKTIGWFFDETICLEHPGYWWDFGDKRNRIIVSIPDEYTLGDGLLDDDQAASTEAIPGPSGQQQQTESALN